MSKSLTRWLYLGSFLLALAGVGFLDFARSDVQDSTADWQLIVTGEAGSGTNYALGWIGLVLTGLAIILTAAALVGALVRMAQLARWGWFVALLLVSGLALLVYVFVGPTTRSGATKELPRTT